MSVGASHGFDAVSDAHDESAVLLHLVDELHGQHAAVKRLTELFSSCVQGTTKPITL